MNLSNLTPTQREALMRAADGEWHLGAALTSSGVVLRTMADVGLIRAAGNGTGYLQDMWTITPMAEKMIEAGE